jgi:hypothetical protein
MPARRSDRVEGTKLRADCWQAGATSIRCVAHTYTVEILLCNIYYDTTNNGWKYGMLDGPSPFRNGLE